MTAPTPVIVRGVIDITASVNVTELPVDARDTEDDGAVTVTENVAVRWISSTPPERVKADDGPRPNVLNTTL